MSIKHKQVPKYLKSVIFHSLLSWMRIGKFCLKIWFGEGGYGKNCAGGGWECSKKGGSWQGQSGEKSHTWEKGGAHLKIYFWHLLMNLINK